MKRFLRPRQLVFGAALLLIVLTACGTPLAGESWAGISTDGKYIYVAWKDSIIRVNPVATGPEVRQVAWIAKVPGGAHAYGAPAIGPDKTLYVGAYDKKVYAFPQNTSQPTPTVLGSGSANPPADRIIGGPLLQNNVLYIGMGDKGVKAYNVGDGSEKWTFDKTGAGVWSTPILDGNTLYFSSLDHFLYALDSSSGNLIWKSDMGAAIAGAPLLYNSFLYVGTFDDQLLKVSADGGKIVNKFQSQGWIWATPIVKDNILYVGDLAGYVYAIDSDSLTVKWKTTYTPDYTGGIRGNAVIATIQDPQSKANTDIVIVGSENKYLFAFNRDTGARVWVSAISNDDQVLSNLIVMGDDVIFTTLADSEIVAGFNVNNGKRDWYINLTNDQTVQQTATSVPLSATEQAGATQTAAQGTTTTAATTAATQAQ